MNSRKQLHQQINELSEKLREVNQLLSSSQDLSMLDIDLLRKTTIDIYEAVNNLRLVKNEKPEVEEKKFTPIFTPEIIIPEIKEAAPEVTEPAPVYNTSPSLNEEPAEITEEEEIVTREEEEEEVPVSDFRSEELFAPAAEPIVEEEAPDYTETSLNKAVEEIIPAEPVEEPIITMPVAPEIKTNTRPSESNDHKDLASKLGGTPIADLKKFISIGKKFELINSLFKGNLEQYTYAIHHLNNMNTGDEAFEYLNQLRREQHWDEENVHYVELADLVRRRFLN